MAVHLRSWAGYAGGAAAGLLFLYLLPHMGPLLVGLLLAILVDRPVTALEARGVGRGLAAALVLGGGALALVLVGVGLGTALYAEVRQLASLLHLAPHAVPSTTGGGVLAEVGWLESLPPLVQDLARRAVEAAYGAVGRWVEGVVQLVAGPPALVWPLTVSLLVAYFASRDRRMLAEVTLRFLPGRLRRRAARLRGRFLGQVAAFLHAQVVVVGLSALLSAIALALLGSPFAVSLGLLAGLLDIIPFLGPATVFGVLAGVRVVQGALGPALAAAACGLAVTAVRQVAETRVVAGRTQLHPLTVVVAIYLGGRLLGAAGFLAGPVIALAAKALLAEGTGRL
ncbi:MAG: AI-2E family transporter [Firmicutes bacterium]|nr:AI-2E family transporter [Bacillota bacterium]